MSGPSGEKQSSLEDFKPEKINIATLKVFNTQSSTAGAGSGTFHLFRKERKAENTRNKQMVAMHNEEVLEKNFQARRKETAQKEEAETQKRAKRRQRMKDAKRRKRLREKEERTAKKQPDEEDETAAGELGPEIVVGK